MFKIILKGNPLSTQTIYRATCLGGFSRLYMTAQGKQRKEDYQWQVKQQWKGGILDWSLELEIKLYFGDNKKRDFDNFHKLTMDALTGIVWIDDSQIQKATIEKFYDKENPRVEINITKIN